ncbi:MAG: protein kinase [Muribaculaceae bacterium]|nr:protein kinase [Muribaculaceae bacterium]
MQFSENQLFDGRYLLVELIGRGASAEVWKATDTKAGDMLVAVKIYKPDTLGPGSAGIAEFQREFTMVYNMTHTNLLHPQGFDIADGAPYLVMAFCENGSATSMVGRCDQEEVLHFLRDVAAGLEYLHDHNITHQDIKPDNVLVDDNCNFMVTDFGISRRGAVNDAIGGTRAYMAPEVYKGKPEHASDIWSLGATAVELVTGQPPYGELGGAAQLQHPGPVAIDARLSAPVKKLINDMLDPDPRKRPSAATVRSIIDHYRETGSWNRNVQRNKIAYIATGIAALLLCVGLFFWDINRTKVRYYNDYTEIWGVPKGVGHVSAFDQKHRAYTYKMEYKGGKLRHLTMVNARGNVVVPGETELQGKFTEAAFYYTNDGNVDYVKVYNQGGECIYVMDFDANLKTVIFKSDDEHGTEKPLRGKTTETALALTDKMVEQTAVTRYLITYDEKGRYSRIEYATFQNVSVTDDDMIHGLTFEYDDNDRVTRKTSIGLDGQPRGNQRGLATKEYTYDSDGNWVAIKYLAVDGSPSSDGTNVPYFTHSHDKYGNIISEEYFNLEGEPMMRSDVNAAAFRYILDDEGLTVKMINIGVDGKPTTIANGSSSQVYEYDDRGYVRRTIFLDLNDSVVNALSDGFTYAIIEQECNERGLPSSIAFFDRNRQPVENAEGVHYVAIEYDSVGHAVKRGYFDKGGKPFQVGGYFAAMRSKYNHLGLPIEESYYDENDKPVNGSDGYAVVKYEYDLAGHLLKSSLFGTDGKPVMSNTRYSIQENEYDSRGNRIAEKLFDTEGKPVDCPAGWQTARMVYDPASNNRTAVYRYNVAGRQVSGEEYKYDSRGNVVEEKLLAGAGQLREKTAVEHTEYDARNRAVRFWYTNQSGEKVNLPSDRYHEVRYKYDRNGNVSDMTYWSTGGQPVLSNTNVHRIVKEYNDRNQMVHWLNLDTNGNPIVTSDQNPPEARYEYDARGNQVVQAILDGRGQPHNSVKGYQKKTNAYDDRNRMVETCYFDKDGRPVRNKDTGFSREVYAYDNHGNQVKAEYYDGTRLALVQTMKYNRRDQIVEQVTRDGDGKVPADQTPRLTLEYEADEVTPKKLTAYDIDNKVMAWATWNKETGEWNAPQFANGGGGGGASYSYSYSGTASWQQECAELARQCPVRYDNDLVLESISYGSDYLTMTVKLTNLSKYEITEDQIATVRDGMSGIRAAMGGSIPSYVRLNVVILDKAGRRIL